MVIMYIDNFLIDNLSNVFICSPSQYYLELDGVSTPLTGIDNGNGTLILGYLTSFERPGSINITVWWYNTRYVAYIP